MNTNQDLPCRHEYVKIFQRKLKGLERRLLSTRAWLPLGFKPQDLQHLGEGSFCFCTKCRARLYPRRTQAEKLQARLALKEQAAQKLEAAKNPDLPIDVEELELEQPDFGDIVQEGVKVENDEEACRLSDDEEL